jgi:hypothetical protein
MFFTTCHSVILLIFAVTLVFAGIKVFELRNTSAGFNERLFTFGYFSLSAWIIWILQYAILVGPFLSLPADLSVHVLSLAGIQNAFWASAVLSLHLKQFSRKSLTLPFLAIFSAASILVVHQTTSEQLAPLIGPIDGSLTAVVFIVLGISIVQLRLSRISAVIFLIHGFTQGVWIWIWRDLFSTTPAVHLTFPLWRLVLLIAWWRLISGMMRRAQPAIPVPVQLSDQKPGNDNEQPELSNLQVPLKVDLPVPLKVMISSTVEDLGPEREVADRAIRKLNLTRWRSETFGSVPHPPKVVCEFLAQQCDIFLLIIGERYGHTMSDGKSVVEFEYRTARAQNPQKILVYVKDVVDREPQQKEFLKCVQDFEHGYFRSSFSTPDDLHDKIQSDIGRWLAWQVMQSR